MRKRKRRQTPTCAPRLWPGPSLTDTPGTGQIDVDPSPESDGHTSRANTAIVAAAVLDLPATAGRTIEFCDGTLPVAAALEPQL